MIQSGSLMGLWSNERALDGDPPVGAAFEYSAVGASFSFGTLGGLLFGGDSFPGGSLFKEACTQANLGTAAPSNTAGSCHTRQAARAVGTKVPRANLDSSQDPRLDYPTAGLSARSSGLHLRLIRWEGPGKTCDGRIR